MRVCPNPRRNVRTPSPVTTTSSFASQPGGTPTPSSRGTPGMLCSFGARHVGQLEQTVVRREVEVGGPYRPAEVVAVDVRPEQLDAGLLVEGGPEPVGVADGAHDERRAVDPAVQDDRVA